MKINIHYACYKWEIITFLVRTTGSFHALLFPLLALHISSSGYYLWPDRIHSFMISQAPAEVINYSSWECLYFRRSQYRVMYTLRSPLSGRAPSGLGLPFSFKQWNETHTAQNTCCVFPPAPENSQWKRFGSSLTAFPLSVFLMLSTPLSRR